MSRTIFLVLTAALVVACTKTDASPQPAPEPSASTPVVEASTGVILAASTVPPVPAPSVSVSASAAPSAVPAPSGSVAAVDCGSKEKPCPLQGWMRENINPPMNRKDLPGLAAGLDKIVSFAPAGYTNWVSIAKDGAAAARSGDLDATKASCRGCHDQYKRKYKTELRGRKI